MNAPRKLTAIITTMVMAMAACAVSARGDEGMWLFSNPPLKLLE
jgi:hypothetical protein